MLKITTRDSVAQHVPLEVTIALLTYKRPEFLKECIKSLKKNAGRDFKLIIWDNKGNNIGGKAIYRVLPQVKTKYLVQAEDDMIWFSPNWLDKLVKAFEAKPNITEDGKKLGFKDEWGMVSTMGLVDKVNNSGMWPEKFTYSIKVGNYFANVRPHGGASIVKTEVLKSLLQEVPHPHLNKWQAPVIYAIEQARYPMAYTTDAYVYHAASPYWNQLYPDVWLEKQKDQTVWQAMDIFKQKGNFDFNDPEPMQAFLKGNFDEYATKLYRQSRVNDR